MNMPTLPKEDQGLIEECRKAAEFSKEWKFELTTIQCTGILQLLSIISRQQKALELVMYYVEGDATYEALCERVKNILDGK